MPDGASLPSMDVTDILTRHEKSREATETTAEGALEAARAAQAKMMEAFTPPPRTPPEDYSGVAMAIAALGGALTHQPLTVAAQSMAGVLDAYQKGDAARAKQAYDQWQAAHEAAGKMVDLELKTYEAAMKRLDNDPRALLADLQAQTAAFKNEAIGSRLAAGDLQGAVSLIHASRRAAGGIRKAGTGFTETHDTMMSVADAEKAVTDAAQSGDKDAYAAAIDKLNEARNELATAIEDGKVKPRKGVTVSELRKPIPGGTQMGGISDEAAALVAERVLAGDERATTGMARSQANMTKVTNAVERIAKERGLSGADIATRIAEFQGTTAGERTLGTRTANMEVAANEAKNMIPLALSASRDVNRTDYPSLNSIIQSAERGTGDPNIVRFGLAANSLIYTYAKFLNPTGIPTDADKARATDILSTAWAEGQFEAALDQIQKEIQSGRAAITQTRGEFREGLSGKTTPEAPRAAAPPKYHEGQTATNPTTGQKLVFKGGQWVPQ